MKISAFSNNKRKEAMARKKEMERAKARTETLNRSLTSC